MFFFRLRHPQFREKPFITPNFKNQNSYFENLFDLFDVVVDRLTKYLRQFKKQKNCLSLLAEGSVFLPGAVALDGLDVLVGRLCPELVGQVHVQVAILGFEFFLKI